jgi:hypothetical protein
MGKVKNLDKNLYPSIQDAILEILDCHLIYAFTNSHGDYTGVYGERALEEACYFLIENNIQHQYTILPAPANSECKEIVSLVWSEPGVVGHEVWYSAGLNKKAFRVSMTVFAESKDEVEDWLNELNDVDVRDWGVAEL